MGETSACFHILGTLPIAYEYLKRFLTGGVNGWASSLRSLLLIESGPEALPIFKDVSTDVTASDETEMESNLKGGKSESGGKEVLLSTGQFVP